MNYKNRVLRQSFLLVIGLAGLLCGCSTDASNDSHSPSHKDSHGFYEAFTNHIDSPLPKPTGPFAVGRTDLLLTDSSRDILYRTLTNGSLMTTIWYPADNIGNRIPSPYVNPREMMAWVELFRKYGARWDASQRARLTNSGSYAFTDAPLAPYPRKFPAILYVHGQVGLRTDNSGSAEELASHGFIVVSSAHGGTAGMELPDGTMVKPKLEYHLSGNDTNSIAIAVFQDQTKDLEFVIDELGRLNIADGRFAGRIDTSRIGVFGFSYGGASAAELCNVDHRCRAGAALDPGGHPDLSKIHFKQPFLILTGPHGISAGSQRLFGQLAHDVYFINIRNAGHGDFSDAAEFLQPSEKGRNQTVVRKYLVAFFAKYLKGVDGKAALDLQGPTDPEIQTFMKK